MTFKHLSGKRKLLNYMNMPGEYKFSNEYMAFNTNSSAQSHAYVR